MDRFGSYFVNEFAVIKPDLFSLELEAFKADINNEMVEVPQQSDRRAASRLLIRFSGYQGTSSADM
eukprot:1972333-Amphidinium_carterae.1